MNEPPAQRAVCALILSILVVGATARASLPHDPAPRTAGTASTAFDVNPAAQRGPLAPYSSSQTAEQSPPSRGEQPRLPLRPPLVRLAPVVSESAPKPPAARTSAESWLLEQVRAGKPADFADRGDRTLAASFLYELLSGQIGDAHPSTAGVHVRGATIDGDLDLSGLDVATKVVIERVDFRGAFKGRDSAFQSSLKIIKSHVTGAVDLSGASIDGALEMEESRFEGDVLLPGTKISGPLFLDNARFRGDFDLSGASVAGGIQAFGASFAVRCGEEGEMACSRDALERSEGVTAASRAKTTKTPIRFYGADVGGRIILDQALFGGDIDARHLRVARDLSIARTVFAGVADFAASSVAEYLILDAPVFRDKVRLAQVQYGAIANGDAEFNAANTWRDLKPIYRQCAFSSDLYARLEDFFKTRGDSAIADEVYIEEKCQERQNQHAWSEKIVSWLEYWLMGYGRHPEYAFGWSAVFVIIGAVVFRRKIMRQVETEKPTAVYNAFWYSLDVFLPLTRLHAADQWVPDRDEPAAWVYMRIHHLVGWILIPLGLAAVSGLVK